MSRLLAQILIKTFKIRTLRILIIIISLTMSLSAKTQIVTNDSFDSTNYFTKYYDFKSNDNIKGHSFSVNWVDINDAKEVMVGLFKEFGIDSVVENKLFKIDSNKYLPLTYYLPKSNVGILYTQNHIGYPMPKKRVPRYQNESFNIYSQVIFDKPVGKPKMQKLESLPNNIIIVNQNYYWFQKTDNQEDDKYLVSKSVALRILREDLKTYLNLREKITD